LAGWAPPPRSPPPPREPRTAKLWIIVPVYEDLEATRACLAATLAQLDQTGARLVVIDDASPNAALRGWLDINAATGRLELIRNPDNLGFAASINRALSLCLGGDVVLLNADALPPPGVFGRLAALARSAAMIGTLTPLSNNGETCSFPTPNASSPLPPEDEIARLDALARRANGDRLIDLPNGIGFCLYISRACLDAVGTLPEIYGRGYYEDVEFCLRAREKGFRTVCASGVYVGHAGSLSFGAEKRRLVTKNLQLLKSRFPAHEAECAAFLRSDPLKTVRGAIERLDPPRQSFHLLVAAAGVCALEAQAQARRWNAGGEAPAPLLCLYDPTLKRVSLRGPEGETPQSLDFSLRAPGGLDELRDWLGQLDLSGVTVFFSATLPAPLVELFASIDPDLELTIADLDFIAFGGRSDGACAQPEGIGPCAVCAGAMSPAEGASASLRVWRACVRQSAVVRPLDRMVAHVAQRLFGDEQLVAPPAGAARTPQPQGQGPGGQVLGIVSPMPEAGVDALIVTLARVLRRRGDPARIVVYGRCLDDLSAMASGNVFVTGPVEQDDIVELIGPYGITELMSCSRTRFIGRLDSLASACGLARASFDWSSGALAFDPADLALDPRLCDLKIAERVADWLGQRRLQAKPSSVGMSSSGGTPAAVTAQKVKAR
jgi:GT2 family glycosyltransferase